MADRDKIALLCILIIVGISIWSKPKIMNNNNYYVTDIFQQAENNAATNKMISKFRPLTRIEELKATVKYEFGKSPFQQ